MQSNFLKLIFFLQKVYIGEMADFYQENVFDRLFLLYYAIAKWQNLDFNQIFRQCLWAVNDIQFGSYSGFKGHFDLWSSEAHYPRSKPRSFGNEET